MSRCGHVISVNPYENKKKVANKRRNLLPKAGKRKEGELKEMDNSRKCGSIGDKRNIGKGKM